MAVIGFTQDPQAPEGAGLFHMDDGRDLYAHDPDMARQAAQPSPDLMQAAQGQDMRVAGPGGAQSDEDRIRSGLGLGQANRPPPPQGAPPSLPPSTGGGPTSPEAGSFPLPAQQTGPQQNPQQVLADRINAPVYHARTKGGLVPSKGSQTVEQEGLPYDPEDAAVRIKANNQVMEAKAATAELMRTRAIEELTAAKARQPELQLKAAQAQVELDRQHQQYRNERLELDGAIQQSNKTQGGASEWFSSKGTVAQLAMVLGQAFGAYAATLSGGENWAQKQINTIMDHDIAAQKEQAKRGVDNAYRRLELRYKDSDQAEAALRLAQGNVLANVQSMHASANQAEDVQAAHQEMLAQNQQSMVAQEQKFQNAAYGKHKTEMAGAVVAPSAGGYRAPTEAEKGKRINTIKGEQDVGATQDTSREGRALDIKEKAAEAKRKADPAIAKAQDQLNSIDNSIRNAEELDKLYAKPGVLSRAERGRMEYLQSVSPMEVHKGLTGMSRFTDTEGERYATAYGHQGETLDYTGKHRAALGALREDLAHKKAQLEKAIHGGAGAAAEEAESGDVKDVE